MTMGENDRCNIFAKLFQDIKIGDRDIDAIDALFGKTHPGIDDNHLVTKAQQGAIHPELPDAAERNYSEDVRHYRFLLNSLARGWLSIARQLWHGCTASPMQGRTE